MYDFGLLLKELRLKRGFSQTQLAQKISKSKAVISRYESNQQMPTLETLVDLAQLYNVSLDYLVGIDKCSLLTNGLSVNQIKILDTLIFEFHQRTTPAVNGMSAQQLQIINMLFLEFTNPSS